MGSRYYEDRLDENLRRHNQKRIDAWTMKAEKLRSEREIIYQENEDAQANRCCAGDDGDTYC